jgi:UDP-glucose 4-epimerase
LKVAVTGGAGYIGSHATAELLQLGHQVTVIDDFSAGHVAAVPPAARLVRGDIGDAAAMSAALDGHDAVIHFAGLLSVGGSMKDPRSYFETNFVKAMALLDAARVAGVGRVVFSSTCATYGVPQGPLTEDHPKEPVNPYGASKRAFEQVLEAYARIGQLRAIALRYFNAAGARKDGSLGEDHTHEEHLIPLALDAAAGRRGPLTVFGDDYDTPDGTCLRDYIHVDDLARAHALALDAVGPYRDAVHRHQPRHRSGHLGSRGPQRGGESDGPQGAPRNRRATRWRPPRPRGRASAVPNRARLRACDHLDRRDRGDGVAMARGSSPGIQ